ncbi:MAG: cation:proton antiporter [Muribaculaceae bacterium]|nr:cation:proton antiporter [Muribaculaceae bacterium]
MILSLAIPATHPAVTSPVAIFLIVLAIILITPILLNKLKIPHVIGLIVAGVLVGPYGFNVLARDMSFEVFGQVGLLYLMFLAGIEIDMYHLKKNIRKGALFGLYTFLIPMIVGTAASVALLHVPLISAVLLASMFAAHTLIAYPIVSRLGLTKSKPVVIAIAGTIFTVLGSLMVLAAVRGIATTGEFRILTMARLIGSLIAYCLVVLYAYPRLTRWFFKRFNDGVSQFIYVLSMVFLAAVTASWIGIEGVFGAFFAGLILNRYIPARTPLMSRLEFVGNAIFIPYFLIGVGMLINVGVVTSGWQTLYVAAVMSAVAMAAKWLAALATQRTFHMSGLDRSMIYQLSNAHTAVALAVVMIGYEIGIFGEDILNGTVIMILVTCTVSSIGTSRAAMKMKLKELENADSPVALPSMKQPHTLVTVDNPTTAQELVTLALMIRSGAESSGKLYALHVRNDSSAMSRSVCRSSLDIAEKVAASADTSLLSIERFDLNFVTGVLNTIEERDIGEVVIGLHRRNNVIDTFFGDKLTQLIKATNRMIIISRCYIPVSTTTRIVIAVPDKAEYETGFRRWVEAIANLTREIGCRAIFCCHPDTRRSIKAVLRHGGYGIRAEYRDMSQWDDFILLSNKILDDDLFVVITARRTSLSFTSEMDNMPDFLKKYFAHNNLLIIYPDQFGHESDVPTMAETLSTDIVSTPSPLWLHIMNIYRGAVNMRKRITHRHRRHDDRIDF